MNIALYHQDIMGTVFTWTQEFTPAQVCTKWKKIFDTVREDISKQILSDIEKSIGIDNFYKLRRRFQVIPANAFLKAIFRDLAKERPSGNMGKVPNAAEYIALNQDLDNEENIHFIKQLPLGMQFLSRPHVLALTSSDQVKAFKKRMDDDGLLIELDKLTYSAKARCPTLLFKLTNLTHLDLSDGKISVIPPKFSRLTHLITLSLINNPFQNEKKEVEELKITLKKFTNLSALNLFEHKEFNLPIRLVENLFKKDIESGEIQNTEVDEELTALLKGSLRTKKWCSCMTIAQVIISIVAIFIFGVVIIYFPIAISLSRKKH